MSQGSRVDARRYRVRCPHCGLYLRSAPPRLLGRKVRCKACGGAFRLGDGASVEPLDKYQYAIPMPEPPSHHTQFMNRRTAEEAAPTVDVTVNAVTMELAAGMELRRTAQASHNASDRSDELNGPVDQNRPEAQNALELDVSTTVRPRRRRPVTPGPRSPLRFRPRRKG